MKAAVFTRYGPPEVLEIREVPTPTPKAAEVLVKVRSTAVNDWDWSMVRGKPHVYRLMTGVLRPKVTIPGAEVAGTVEAVGERVTRFRPGDDVYGDISEAGFGGFAEYVCVDEGALVHKPTQMTFQEAAAIPHAAGLARQGLVDVGRIQPGDRVLINGAGGGVGVIGVQLAKAYGAIEVAGVDSVIKLEAMLSIGFDRVIDYAREDFTGGAHHYDLILDTKTNRSTFRYLPALRPGGRYVTVGGSVPRLLETLCLGPLIRRRTTKDVRIVALKPNKDLEVINALFENGSGLELAIDGPFALTDIQRGLARFGEARHIGKVVIDVAP